MGGSGGGASGAVSYPAHMVTFHAKMLDHTGADSPSNSFIDAFNAAYGNSPFASAVSYDPNAEVASAVSAVDTFNAAITSLNFLTDTTTAVATARNNFLQGTTTLDSTPLPTTVPPPTVGVNPSVLDTSGLDVTTLDTISVSPGEIAADVAAMDTILTDQIEQSELPRFKAGMLNINAIHSSAFIIGEALIRTSKDKALIKYGTDLQIKIGEQVRDINAKHALSYREITARLQTSQKEINARHSMSYRDLNQKDVNTTKELNSRHQEAAAERFTRLELSQMELDARHKISNKELNAKFYIHREEMVRLSSVAMLADLMKKVEFTNQFAHITAEVRRFAIVAFKEQREEQLAIDESDGKWDLELFTHAGRLLAAPSGGVAQGNDRKSRAMSAVGGAISGAAAGTMAAGPGWGTAIGAVAGIGLSFLQ